MIFWKKFTENGLAEVLFGLLSVLFNRPVIIEESSIKFPVTLSLKEQPFNYGSTIVKFWEVAHQNPNYASVKAVDATDDT